MSKHLFNPKIIFTLLFLICFSVKSISQCCNFHATLFTNDVCSVAGDKTQTVNVTNGTAPYTYQWYNTNTNTFVAGTTAINTSGVNHAVAIVTDINGCIDTTMGDWYPDLSSCTTVGIPPTTVSATCANFNIIISKNDGPLLGDVIITGKPSGGTSTTFNYFWYGTATSGYVSGTGTGASFNSGSLTNGLHFMQVTDGNGCNARDSIYISDCNACIDCASDSISLNTGVNNMYSLLPSGSFDNHWVLTATPAASGTTIAPYVVSVPDPGWANITSATAKWINYDDVSGPNSFLFGLHTFTRKFTVCQGGNFLINYTALADNDVSMYIDGTLISATTGSLVGYLLPNAANAVNFPVTLTAGVHKIDAVVNNVGNLQGLWVAGKISPAPVSPGIIIPDTCLPKVVNFDTSDCNVVYDNFSNPALWIHPVLSPAVANPAYYNTLNINTGSFKFLQSRDNNVNYMYRNVGAIDNTNFEAKIDFNHQTTIPGWGTSHVLLALNDVANPFFSNPFTSIGGMPGSTTPLTLTNAILDGIAITYKSVGITSISTYEFKMYIKDNGVQSAVGTTVAVPGNVASYLSFEKVGTNARLTVYSNAARTAAVGNTGWFTIPATIIGLNHAVIGTMEWKEVDRMLTGSLDNLCIKNTAPTAINVIDNKNLFSMQPNPTSEFVTITADTKIDNIQIQAINGQEIWHEKCNGKSTTIITTLFPKGMYFVKVQIGGRYFVEKLLVQ
jgi:Secretion system C-terminal sorting domain